MHLDAVKNFKQALDQMVADNEVTAAYANQLIRLMRAGLNQYAAAAGFGGSFDYVATGSGRPMRSRFDVERERSNATPLAFTNVQKKAMRHLRRLSWPTLGCPSASPTISTFPCTISK